MTAGIEYKVFHQAVNSEKSCGYKKVSLYNHFIFLSGWCGSGIFHCCNLPGK